MGALAILLILIALVAATLGFGPACHAFDGIQPICLAPAEQFAFIVVAVLAGLGAAFIFGRARAQKRVRGR